jgi:hypothetical protein
MRGWPDGRLVNTMDSPTTPYPQEPGRYPQDPGTYPQGRGGYPPERGTPAPPRRSRPRVDAGTLWSGGAATAVVAGLIALVGVLASRWLFNVPILAPKRDGAYGDANTTTLVLAAFGAALVATLLAHLLLLGVPRPMVFFRWIVGLVTVVFVIFPFQTTRPLSEKFATAVLYLVLGIAIGGLISVVADRATRVRPTTGQSPGSGY